LSFDCWWLSAGYFDWLAGGLRAKQPPGIGWKTGSGRIAQVAGEKPATDRVARQVAQVPTS